MASGAIINVPNTAINEVFNNTFTASEITLYNCSGSIADTFRYCKKGNVITICGRTLIQSFSRIGVNAGLVITLDRPVKYFNQLLANGYSAVRSGSVGWADAKIRIGENIIVSIDSSNHKKIMIFMSETHQNTPSSGDVYIVIPPITLQFE